MSLYHEPGFDTPRIDDIPVVTTIHGLAHQQIPQLLIAERSVLDV